MRGGEDVELPDTAELTLNRITTSEHIPEGHRLVWDALPCRPGEISQRVLDIQYGSYAVSVFINKYINVYIYTYIYTYIYIGSTAPSEPEHPQSRGF